MALYSGTVTAPGAIGGSAIADLKSGAATKTMLTELSVALGAGVAIVSLLGRSTTELIQCGAAPLQAYDPNDGATATSLATAWTVAPAIPVQAFRRSSGAAVAGAVCIWSFPRGITVALAQSLVLWAVSGSAATVSNVASNWEVDE